MKFTVEEESWKSFVSIADRRRENLKLIISLLLCFVLFAAFTVFCTATNEKEASSRINDTENAWKNAFRTAWKAKRSNANVSSIMIVITAYG